MAVADDRMAARVEQERGGKKQATRCIVGIIEPHVDFTANDVLFLFKFGLGQGGEKHQAR